MQKHVLTCKLLTLCVASAVDVMMCYSVSMSFVTSYDWTFSSFSSGNVLSAPEYLYNLIIRNAHKDQRDGVQNQTPKDVVHHIQFHTPSWHAACEIDCPFCLCLFTIGSCFQYNQLGNV